MRPRHSDVKLHAHLPRPTNTIRRARGYLHIAIVCVLLTSGIRDPQLQHSRTRWRTQDRRPRARENARPTVRIGRCSSTCTSIPLAKLSRPHLVGTSDVRRGLRWWQAPSHGGARVDAAITELLIPAGNAQIYDGVLEATPNLRIRPCGMLRPDERCDSRHRGRRE